MSKIIIVIDEDNLQRSDRIYLKADSMYRFDENKDEFEILKHRYVEYDKSMYDIEKLHRLISLRTVAEDITHCDECCYGCFDYVCPVCRRAGNEYNIWPYMNDIMNGEPEDFPCDHCKAQLNMYWDKSSDEFYVKRKIENR